jgi:hypothetical protein
MFGIIILYVMTIFEMGIATTTTTSTIIEECSLIICWSYIDTIIYFIYFSMFIIPTVLIVIITLCCIKSTRNGILNCICYFIPSLIRSCFECKCYYSICKIQHTNYYNKIHYTMKISRHIIERKQYFLQYIHRTGCRMIFAGSESIEVVYKKEHNLPVIAITDNKQPIHKLIHFFTRNPGLKRIIGNRIMCHVNISLQILNLLKFQLIRATQIPNMVITRGVCVICHKNYRFSRCYLNNNYCQRMICHHVLHAQPFCCSLCHVFFCYDHFNSDDHICMIEIINRV